MSWKKDNWDKSGRWHDIEKHREISVGDKFSGVVHVFYNPNTLKAPGQTNTLKVFKTRKDALSFTKIFMKKR